MEEGKFWQEYMLQSTVNNSLENDRIVDGTHIARNGLRWQEQVDDDNDDDDDDGDDDGNGD